MKLFNVGGHYLANLYNFWGQVCTCISVWLSLQVKILQTKKRHYILLRPWHYRSQKVRDKLKIKHLNIIKKKFYIEAAALKKKASVLPTSEKRKTKRFSKIRERSISKQKIFWTSNSAWKHLAPLDFYINI